MGMILKGDCIEVMKAMRPNSVDAIVTDPPYGLEFMGKEWDRLYPDKGKWKGREHKPTIENRKDSPYLRSNIKQPAYLLHCVNCGGNSSGEWNRCKCDNPQFKIPDKVRLASQLWHTQWLTEAYRVLKPGGSMLVMGGTRTSHRLACAIEDSGFIIKDTLAWNYGSGFPKAQDFSKATLKKFLREWLEDVDRFHYKYEGFQFDCPYNCHLCDELLQFFQVSNQDNEHKQDDVQEHNHLSEPLAKTLFDILCKRKAYYASLFFRPAKQGYQLHIVSSDGQLSQKKFSDLSKLCSEQLKQGEFGDVIPQAYKDSSNVDILSCEFVLEKFEKFCHNYDISRLPSYKHCNRINQFIQAKLLRGHKIGGLKPAWEPILYSVKPPEGSYVDNVLKWGVGAVNVDETRIGIEQTKTTIKDLSQAHGNQWGKAGIKYPTQGYKDNPKGRFPANVILSHHPECVQVGMKRVKAEKHSGKVGHGKDGQVYGKGIVFTGSTKCYADKDGLETVESWDCHPDCAVRLLDEQSGMSKSPSGRCKAVITESNRWKERKGIATPGHTVIWNGKGDSGGASRFFYCAKSSRGERNAGLEGMEKQKKHTSSGDDHVINEICPYHHITLCKCGWRSKAVSNFHPTVKPIKLFEWLIKLVTREGQIVLDPFIGSGTTAIAAHNTGRKCVGIEKEDEYLTIAKRRIDYWESQPKQMEIGA